LRPQNEVILLGSSRTDSGVHAIQSTATVDLIRSINNPGESDYYEPSTVNHTLYSCIIVICLNFSLSMSKESIWNDVVKPSQLHKEFIACIFLHRSRRS
jgi:hypothetical protein